MATATAPAFSDTFPGLTGTVFLSLFPLFLFSSKLLLS